MQPIISQLWGHMVLLKLHTAATWLRFPYHLHRPLCHCLEALQQIVVAFRLSFEICHYRNHGIGKLYMGHCRPTTCRCMYISPSNLVGNTGTVGRRVHGDGSAPSAQPLPKSSSLAFLILLGWAMWLYLSIYIYIYTHMFFKYVRNIPFRIRKLPFVRLGSGMPQAVELVRLNLPQKDRKALLSVDRKGVWNEGIGGLMG